MNHRDELAEAEAARQQRMRESAPTTWWLYEQALTILVKPYEAGGADRQALLDALTFRLGELARAGVEVSPWRAREFAGLLRALSVPAEIR
jgi:hypothetical protein